MLCKQRVFVEKRELYLLKWNEIYVLTDFVLLDVYLVNIWHKKIEIIFLYSFSFLFFFFFFYYWATQNNSFFFFFFFFTQV